MRNRGGVDELLRTVPAVIRVSGVVDGLSAVTLAARFSPAMASAQTAATVVEQASVAMIAASLDVPRSWS